MIRVVPPIDWQKKYGVSEEVAQAIANELNSHELMLVVENRVNDCLENADGRFDDIADKITYEDIKKASQYFAEDLDNSEDWDLLLNEELDHLRDAVLEK